jgi:hypothetical protein
MFQVDLFAYTLPECRQILADSLAGYAHVRAVTPGFDAPSDSRHRPCV